jgi:DNA replication regulator SLD2
MTLRATPRLVRGLGPLDSRTELIHFLAAKYKEYNKARDILSGKISIPPPQRKEQTPQKRKHEEGARDIVSKRQQIVKTPSKTPSKVPLQPWEVDPYDSPSVVRNLFTPSKKSLGPTPQKDGHVLGLFDLLEQSASHAGDAIPIATTPRRSRTDDHGIRHTRTPASRSKRLLLDGFSTPLKNRDLNDQDSKTPSSVSKLVFSTPSFLRRAQLPTVNEDGDGPLSPQMVRVPRKPLVRGLSSMLAGLRKMEDDAADEDLEALHEMEMMEAGGATNPLHAPIPKVKVAEPPEDILLADNQLGILGAFDDEAALDSEPEDSNLGRDGQPLKVYKKKGQKRTTRRVNMKPSRPKPASRPSIPQNSSQLDSEDEFSQPSHDQTIPETQPFDDLDTADFVDVRNFDSDTQSEYTASEGGTRYRRPNQEKKKSKSANKDGRVKTAARKVTTLANQNFKRLKLRNSGAKGGPGHGSRFRRRK